MSNTDATSAAQCNYSCHIFPSIHSASHRNCLDSTTRPNQWDCVINQFFFWNRFYSSYFLFQIAYPVLNWFDKGFLEYFCAPLSVPVFFQNLLTSACCSVGVDIHLPYFNFLLSLSVSTSAEKGTFYSRLPKNSLTTNIPETRIRNYPPLYKRTCAVIGHDFRTRAVPFYSGMCTYLASHFSTGLSYPSPLVI